MDLIADLLKKTADAISAAHRLPVATYRLQFHAGFPFRDACGLVPYLADLGISHCYASPYLKARPGSTHGYNIIDHGALNPEIGTEEDYDALVAALKARGLGQILDIVPNHMGVATNDNAWWNDVLENGPASRFAGHFDIAWRASLRPELLDKVLLPVLGEPYGDVLDAGQLTLTFANGSFAIAYFDRRLPVDPRGYAQILELRLEELEKTLGAEAPALVEYQSILTAARNLPDRTEADPGRLAERWREKEVIKRRLAALLAANEPIGDFINQNVALFNGRPGDTRSFDRLHGLLEHQCYRLSYWRVALDEINYRRFFDVNDLAALSMERPEVFTAAHGLVLRLLAEGKIDGLRVDHPDGLYDPAEYFRRLQEHFILACAHRVLESDPTFRDLDRNVLEGQLKERLAAARQEPVKCPLTRPLYVVVEKILGASEALAESWLVHGTSGYDFLNLVNGLFVDARSTDAFTRLYRELTQDGPGFAEVAHWKKLLILDVALASELHMLTHQLDRLAQKSRKSRDFTFNTLRSALREVIACLPVYRAYISDEGVHETDRRYVEAAVRRASVRNPLMSRRVLRFVRDMLLLEPLASFAAEDRAEQRRFAGKFQQVTAPVMAKGVEDTAFYVYNRLVSLNEVGGQPGRFGVSPETLHRYNQERQAKWPASLSPLSTHDTKRGEDVRARINVLSELPEEWQACIGRWRKLNEPYRTQVDDETVPDANEEYLLYQTLIGAWPLEPYSAAEYAAFVSRIQAYMEKALHEAKVHTSWINPNEAYDQAIREFIARTLNEETSQAFLDDFRAFQRRISHYGLLNSLAQTLLKITCAGVPDTYQGTEIWDFSLVDPDNRRPVDYQRRRAMLDDLQSSVKASEQDLSELARSLLASKEDGRIKLYVTYRALHCRRDHPLLFSGGEYLPLTCAGKAAQHVFAFARHYADTWAIVAVPRLLARLAENANQEPLGAPVWDDTRLNLPPMERAVRWHNVLTGERTVADEQPDGRSLAAADLFRHFPIALLFGQEA
jgi:(1->4)-alpha-D-glucan 1-alpha-D-glucosylmutase